MTDPHSLGHRIHPDDYRVELTELLLAEAAWLTGEQLVMVRKVVMCSVESHGWLIDEPFPE